MADQLGDRARETPEQSMSTIESKPRSLPPKEKMNSLNFGVNMFAMYIAVFCVALDNTIISTAIPQITDEFHALNDVGWYGSAYTLTQCVFQLVFGNFYKLFTPKRTFLMSLLLFEVGSLLCGVAPTSLALIFGRAISGVGAAGVFQGVLIIITHTSPLEKRPIWQGLISGIFGIASILGPLVGGAFTTHVTWRWCFYINLPLGGITAAIILIFLHITPVRSASPNRTVLKIFLMLDPLGLVLFMASIVCLFLALQWGGTTYPWSDAREIALFVVFGVLLVAFGIVEWRLGEDASIPFRIISQRTIWAASWFAFFISGSFFLFVYFIPIYFQAIRAESAMDSSIHTLPLILANVILAVLSGLGVSKLGYINPFCFASVLFTCIGAGLLTTLTPETWTGKWVGYQILFGLGCGLGFQQPPNAPQTVLPFKDLPKGIAITLCARNLGASLLLATGSSVLDSQLLQRLQNRSLPGVDPKAVLDAGATGFRSVIPTAVLNDVVEIYNEALQTAFRVGLIVSCIAIFGAVALEWKSVKARPQPSSLESSEGSNDEEKRKSEHQEATRS